MQVYVWNLRHRAILSQSDEPDVRQILFTPDEQRFLTVSCKVAQGTQPSTLVVARALPFGAIIWTLEFNVKKFLPLVMTTDDHFLVGIGLDTKTGKEHVRVFHLRKGIFLHRVNIKYPHFKEIVRMVPFTGFLVSLVDNEKGNIMNCTDKKFMRSVQYWSGQQTKDRTLGLGAPGKGGLYLVDLNTTHVLATFIEPSNEGVFKAEAGFSECESYVWYYHSGRRTIRLFRLADATLAANYALSSPALCLAVTSWSVLAGAQDGTLTMLAIVDPQKGEVTKKLVQQLPSRTEETPKHGDPMAADPLVKFRAAARIMVILNKVIDHFTTRKRNKRKKKKGEIADLICGVS